MVETRRNQTNDGMSHLSTDPGFLTDPPKMSDRMKDNKLFQGQGKIRRFLAPLFWIGYTDCRPRTVAGISAALGQSFDHLLGGIGKCEFLGIVHFQPRH